MDDRAKQDRAPVESDWDPRRALDSLTLEGALHAGDPAATARQILTDNAPMAARSIAYNASFGSNERVRFQASAYILDRVLGKEDGTVASDPFQQLMDEVMKNKNAEEVAARAASGRVSDSDVSGSPSESDNNLPEQEDNQ